MPQNETATGALNSVEVAEILSGSPKTDALNVMALEQHPFDETHTAHDYADHRETTRLQRGHTASLFRFS